MKQFKFGFTVIEMMTAMAIIGVAASFVIPLAVKSYNKHQSEIVLGRAVEHITQGNQNIIQLANMNNGTGSYTDELGVITKEDLYLSATGEDKTESVLNNLSKYIRPYWNLSADTVDNEKLSENIKNFNGEKKQDSPHVTNIKNGSAFNFQKLSASVILSPPEGGADPENSSSDTGYLIYIDTTGLSTPPNTFGKDIFCFHLINDGSLVPLGMGDFSEDPDGVPTNNGLEYTEQVVKDRFRITYY